MGVVVCVSPAAWANRPLCDHVVNVLAQLLDNDADGQPDDPALVQFMVQKQFHLVVPATEGESESWWPPKDGVGQMTGLWEAVPGSCDVPTHRGATADRSTWAAVVGNTPGATGCDPGRDATVEEAHHLIMEAAARVYPAKWGSAFTSEAGKAVQATNGNCGNGYTADWTDPSSGGCVGQYAYNDPTCDEACLVVEGVYWASVAYMGGLYTRARADFARNEWLMTAPDAGMAVLPAGVGNARTLQEGAPALYALVSDTTSAQNAWLPAVMPDGKYLGPANSSGSGGGPSTSSSRTEAPVSVVVCLLAALALACLAV